MPTFTLDMTMMLTFHDALRRDLEHVVAMTSPSAGWERFTRFLYAHHAAEDDALWPVLRKLVAAQPAQLQLLADMESEHASLGALLDEIGTVLDVDGAPSIALVELAAGLVDHLRHEEEHALPLIDRTLGVEQWMSFGEAAASRIGPMPGFLPWLLYGLDTERTNAILNHLPNHAQQAYRNEWGPAYAATSWWTD